MPSTYRVSTFTVVPTEESTFEVDGRTYTFRGFTWDVFGSDRLHTTVEVKNAAELTAAIEAAVERHFDLFPDAPAVHPAADPLRGSRHVRGGKAAAKALDMVERPVPTGDYTIAVGGTIVAEVHKADLT